MRIVKSLVAAGFLLLPWFVSAQKNLIQSGQVSGSFQLDAQYYYEDSLIGAPKVPEEFGSNAFLNILYTNNKFTAGLRYENYSNALQGFSKSNNGSGIPYRFASYTADEMEITVGNFYEQFGSGLMLRTYEDRNIGYDNSIDGVRIKYTVFKALTMKGLIGRQRLYFEKGPGIVRGFDGELSMAELFPKMLDKQLNVIAGGSFVSKFQDGSLDPIYKLPDNVGCYGGRLNFIYKNFNLFSEYAYKINDPSAVNNMIYKPGEALLVSAAYSKKGFGLLLSAKRIDNMNYRSDRASTGNVLMINYLPALTKQHAYTLMAIYPYATQPNGEMGIMGQVNYKLKKGTLLGGHYGTDLVLNYSTAYPIQRSAASDTTAIGVPGTLGYQSDFFGVDTTSRYFEDVNIEISHKFSKKFKAIFMFANMVYNVAVVEGRPGEPLVYANVGVADMTYKFSDKHSLKLELQHLYTKQDKGSWAMAMAELTIAPKWFAAVGDMYNYGHPETNKQIHYYTVSAGYIKSATRIALSYGKQREGLLCVGGVCRYVPAANGFTLSVTSSF
ncbi:MAG: DUF6029 family protein [Bacteroidota bacterium]